MRRLIIATALALTMMGCASNTAPSTTTGSVTYAVTGTAKHVSLTYNGAGGGISQSGATLPYSLTFTATTGQFLYISAQIDTSPDTGSILVSVTKNGALVQSATAVGFPNIGSASGTF